MRFAEKIVLSDIPTSRILSLSRTPAANVDYSDILAELRVLQFKFQRKRSAISITEEQCFNVTILSDVLVENDKVFLVQLSTDDGGVVLSPEQADVVIINNDCKYYILVYPLHSWGALPLYLFIIVCTVFSVMVWVCVLCKLG